MKCIKLGDVVKRVGEKKVDSFLKIGWNYCSKTEWKEYRGVSQQKVEKVEKVEKKKGKGNPKGKAKKNI